MADSRRRSKSYACHKWHQKGFHYSEVIKRQQIPHVPKEDLGTLVRMQHCKFIRNSFLFKATSRYLPKLTDLKWVINGTILLHPISQYLCFNTFCNKCTIYKHFSFVLLSPLSWTHSPHDSCLVDWSSHWPLGPAWIFITVCWWAC